MSQKDEFSTLAGFAICFDDEITFHYMFLG